MQLPADYLNRLRAQLGAAGYAAYLAAMQEPPRRGLRANTLKLAPEALRARLPWEAEPNPLAPEGFVLVGRPEGLGAHPLHRAGLFYLQEPSAMRPAALLDPRPGMCVLDLCAAPGGKAGQIAARLRGRGVLVANELVPARAQVLSRTLERLGVRNALVTCMRPEALCAALAGQCDAVLVDAPCSGEGMFRKEPQAVEDWSPAHVAACAARQANILDSAAQALRPGGLLCYSTCTFAPAEDEEAVEAFLGRSAGRFALLRQERLWPHTCCGEGHFMALLQKDAAAPARAARAERARPRPGKANALPDAWRAFVAEAMREAPQGEPRLLPDGRLTLLPEGLGALLPGWERLRLLRCGVQVGEVRNNRFVPAHALFMAYPNAAFTAVAQLPAEALEAYFLGNTVEIPQASRGWHAVSAPGLDWPVGFGKAVGGTLKNHLPKGLRA